MLEINNITFGYRKGANVLEDFILKYEEPGIYGLLGKNGTGKSTLLYLISGLLRPSAGNVTYNGTDVTLRRPEVLEDLFIVPEEYNLPAIPLEKFISRLKPFYPRFDEELLRRSLESFEMPYDINLGSLSMGQKKKVYMCVALATRTRLLLMDEPTNGLDIPSKSQFRKIVAGNTSEDQTIIISTHQVRDVELLLDHVTMIDKNRILTHSKMDELFSEDEAINLETKFNELLNATK